jgi:hypothetical protein
MQSLVVSFWLPSLFAIFLLSASVRPYEKAAPGPLSL